MYKYSAAPWASYYKIYYVLKFIYSEKAPKFCEIPTLDLTITTQDKSMMEISQKFMAFSECMNFAKLIHYFQLLVALASASVLAEPEAEAQSTVDFEIAGGYG